MNIENFNGETLPYGDMMIELLTTSNTETFEKLTCKMTGDFEKLSQDAHWFVRAEVARQGYCLHKLVNDEHWYVRREVARQSYGLEQLRKDEDPRVRQAAESKLLRLMEE